MGEGAKATTTNTSKATTTTYKTMVKRRPYTR